MRDTSQACNTKERRYGEPKCALSECAETVSFLLENSESWNGRSGICEMGCRLVLRQDVGDRRRPGVRAYAPAAAARSPNCFAGASAIRAAPMIPNIAAAISR